MRFSFTFAVSVAAVAAVSAGVYPVKTGVPVHSKGGNDDGSSERQKPLRDGDRFHMQSPDGQYVFGHTAGNQGRAEMRDKDGTVTGYYSYAGGDGRVVYVNYVADKDGYRVLSNTGVPSASVAIEGGAVEKTAGPSAAADHDFQRVFTDFAKRIKDKLVEQAGQKVMDPAGEGQRQVPVDPTLYPAKETNSSKQGRNEFPDWDQVKKISTTQKPMRDKGQQQQEIVEDPNWDSVKITTQKPDIKRHDNDGQESIDTDRWSATTTTETTLNPVPLVPNQPKGPAKERYSDVVFPEDRIQEISTEIVDCKIEKESAAAAVIDDTENISPVTKPVWIVNDVQTTVLYNDDEPQQTTKSYSRGDLQTTIASVNQYDGSSTVAITAESETERYQVVKEIEENIKNPETDVPTTGSRPLDDEPLAENAPTTGDPSARTDSPQATGETSEIDYTTIAAVDERATTTTTNHSDGRLVADTTAGIRYVTEEIADRAEFRTLEPTERLGTTVDPNCGRSEAQVEEIVWPEIPAQEPVPQVLVPLDPYSKEERLPHTKKPGVKTQTNYLRPARYSALDGVVESTAVAVDANITETATTTVSAPTHFDDGNATFFNFPRFYLTG